MNGLLVAVQPSPAPASPPPLRKPLPRDRPLARPGLGLELRDGPGGMRAILTLPDTIDGRRFAVSVLALGGLAGSGLWLAPGSTSTAFAVAVCVLLAGLAIRIWIGPVFNETAREDDPA